MKTKHWIVFIILGLIWSSSFMWIEIGLREIGPFTLVAFRAFFGLLFGLVVIFFQKVQIPRTLKEWTPLIVLGLTNIAFPFALITWGQKSIDSGVASILDATVPLFTILLAHFMLDDDKMTTPKVLGLLVGFAGVIVLMSKDIGASFGSILGQLAVVIACVFYAGSAIYTRKFTEDTPGIMRSMGPLASATIVMGLTAFFVEAPFKIPALPITWIALLWLGIFGSGLAFLMAFYLMHEIGPTRTTMVTYLFPLGGVTLGTIFLNETLTWQIIVGAILIIGSLAIANWNPKKSMTHRSGFVAIIGRPNVGKSTLLNALLGQKIAAVSPRPQTTRVRQRGILTLPNAQIVFVDTPGLHKSKHKLGEFLNQEAEEALNGVDLILWLVDSSTSPTEEDINISALLNKLTRRTPLLLVLNKTDIPQADTNHENEYAQLITTATIMKVSATKKLGLGEMIEKLIQLLPEREAEYPEEQITDLYEKEIAGDLIRESCLLKLRDEVPHSLAVRIDEFTERENGMAYIAATIFVERESQKGILIGEGGKMMKSIGSAARKQIEEMGGRKVFLELRVKVHKDWRDDLNALKQLGYVKKK